MPSVRRTVAVACVAALAVSGLSWGPAGRPASAQTDPATTTTTAPADSPNPGDPATSGSPGNQPAAATVTTVKAPTTSTTNPLAGILGGGATTTVPKSTTTRPPTTGTTTPPPLPANPPSGPITTPTTRAGGGVPGVPVGASPIPTTTVAGQPPAPLPDPTPILAQVQMDFDQLTAINDFKAAQQLVAVAQSQVTDSATNLQSGQQALKQARADQVSAGQSKIEADAKLRQMAIAAYVGSGFSAPTPGNRTNGHAGPGTVSTPEGLTGIEALDAKEMLDLVGRRARQADDDAKRQVRDAGQAVVKAAARYQQDQQAVSQAESNLLASQQTLHIVTTAAVTPGAASATRLPALTAAGTINPITTLPGTKASNAGSGTVSGAVDTAVPSAPSILGAPIMTSDELAAWYIATGRSPALTVPIAQLTQYYAEWGKKTGVRDDIAFAQSIVETGFFAFPVSGQVLAPDNNFAGIGACDTCAHGWTWPDAHSGVGAQLELLQAYATPHKVDTALVGGKVGVGGCCPDWMALSGVWASSTVYGISIMTVYNQMLTWLIPQRMVAAGLVGATPGQAATSQGPSLAPLPPPPTTTTTSSSTTSTTVAKKKH